MNILLVVYSFAVGLHRSQLVLVVGIFVIDVKNPKRLRFYLQPCRTWQLLFLF